MLFDMMHLLILINCFSNTLISYRWRKMQALKIIDWKSLFESFSVILSCAPVLNLV